MDSKPPPKSLTDENVQLKLYIEDLNKECLDLQASLFEEANKLVLAFDKTISNI